MDRTILTLLFSLVISWGNSQSEIGGIINQYSRVLGIDYCKNFLIVEDASSFFSGQSIIIYQAQGAQIQDSNDQRFGQINNMGAAGLYEINQIQEITGTVITLDFELENMAYDPARGSVQIVSLPSYDNAIIKTSLNGLPWDGAKGGIVALQVSNTLTMEAPINASGLGFRGGVSDIRVENNCGGLFSPNHDNYFYSLNNWRGSTKGEGIADYLPGKEAGRGPQANGGGGGNDHNTGGGGGANLTPGGDGSPSDAGCNGRTPGLAGRAIDSEEGRVFLGGGGGAGHENNKLNTAGGNGGGIVFLIANRIIANGHGIISDGISANMVSGDGAGGGGAGGSIFLDVQSVSGDFNLQAIGGNGGSEDNRNRQTCMGPGGGGSGGAIYQTGNLNSTTLLSGGSAGTSLNFDNCSAGELVAKGGAEGRVIQNARLVKSNRKHEALGIETLTLVEVCAGEEAKMVPTITGEIVSYQWQVDNGRGFVDLVDNEQVSGTQSPVLTIKNANTALQYRIIVAGICGETKSSTAIRLQPQVEPIARFDFTVDGQSVDIINTTGNGDRFFWDFGDGRTSEEVNPGHTYQSEGEYLIQLTAENECGVAVDSQIVVILPGLSAGFSIEEMKGCIPFVVQYNNNSSSNASIVEWLFPGGEPNRATSENPVVVYNTPGLYTASLIVTDGEEIDTLTRDALVEVNEKPVADFEVLADELTVSFANNSTNANQFLWDFGDGTTSAAENPVHQFPSDGRFTVRLTSINECGETDFVREINLIQSPQAAFSYSQNSGCAPLSIQFSDISSGTISTRQWDFPGGDPSVSTALNPIVTYSDAGSFSASLIVGNEIQVDTFELNIEVIKPASADFQFNSDELAVRFTNNSSNASSYQWDFGDGTLSEQENPNHNYASEGIYQVQLISINSCSSDTLFKEISLSERPVAFFSFTPSSACAPTSIQFTSEATGTIRDLQWLFPGGTPATSDDINPTIRYSTPGTYSASLIASNELAVDTFSIHTITIIETAKSDFQFSANELSVSFTNSSTSSNNYIWDFGDGNSSQQANPTHLYTSDGVYTVSLVSSNSCSTDTLSQTISLSEKPVALFSYQPTSACAPSTLQFSNQSSGTINTFQWFFPGGSPSSSNDTNPSIMYAEPGLYSATLVAGNETDIDTFLINSITIVESARSNFQFSADELMVSFTNRSNSSNQFFWDFGDGNTSTEENPIHLFDADGIYSVRLISSNECSDDTLIRQIELFETMNAGFSADETRGCAPFTVSFRDESTGSIEQRKWEFPGGNPDQVEGEAASVTYLNPGTYPVKLILNNAIAQDSILEENYITVLQPTIAQFSTDPDELVVNFTNESVSAETFFWDFGDGSTSLETTPIHAYDTAGVYTVRLFTENECSSDTTSVTLSVEEALAAGIHNDKIGGCAPTTIRFTDLSKGRVENWLWEFPGGEPATSTDPNPIVQYSIPGVYSVKLMVSNETESQTTTLEESILIRELPQPAFDFEVLDGEVRFINLSEGATTYAWAFGDGTQSNEFEPSHTFTEDGSYTVTLNAQNEFCGQATNQQVMITVTALEDQQELNYIRIYPNPAVDKVFVEHNLKNEPIYLDIISVDGKQVYQQVITSSKASIPVEELSPSTYFVTLSQGERKFVYKLLIIE